jgi:hypothetical protein
LVRGEFEALEALDQRDRLSADGLKQALSDYGRTLVEPDADWWGSAEVTPIQAGEFHVAAPLWTEEEGRSDLTLELRLVETGPGDVYQSYVEDVHVL